MKRAMRLSPIYPPWYSGMLGTCYHLMGDNELAIQHLKRPLSVNLKDRSISHG